jgi:YHS domain-containing protein
MLHARLLTAFGLIVTIACLPAVAAGQTSSVNWRTNLDQAKLEAAQTRRFLLVHFTTKTCGPCRLLDQQVFSQPHVGPAIEQHFVPVRLDADENLAVAKMFRVDKVPAEFVVTPEGQILANPPIPNQPEPYLTQLQNIAGHFQQVAAVAAGQAAGGPTGVNNAYAGLPTMQPTAGMGNTQPAPPQVVNNQLAQQQQAPPQTQVNPYAAAPPAMQAMPSDVNRYGQAQNIYAAPPQVQSQAQVAQQPAATPNQSPAGQEPAMPFNAMPRSYRAPEAEGGVAVTTPSAGAAPAAGTAPAFSPGAAQSQAATVAAAAPKGPQLPEGAAPLGFDGYCPVSLRTLNRWTEGNPQFGAVHRGRTYLFAGAEQRDQFLANPDAFSPVFAGLDPVLLLEQQQSVEGSRALGYRYGDAFYLFSSEETKQKFAANPQAYAAGVRQAMNRIDAANGGTVRR